MTGQFDSKLEEEFYNRHKTFIELPRENFFPNTFKDSNGHCFKAKPDFNYNNIYIEFKSHQLNNSATQEIADENYDKQAPYRSSLEFLQLQTAWNHSVYKHGIIARTYPRHYIVVFEDGTKLSSQARRKLREEQILWCFSSDLPAFLILKTAPRSTTIKYRRD